jgi:hypothetical protein
MSGRTHLRNLSIALVVVTLMLLGSQRGAPLVAEPALAPLQQGSFTISPASQENLQVAAGGATSLQLTITNNTGSQVTNVTLTSASENAGYTVDFLSSNQLGTFNVGDSKVVTLRISPAADRPTGENNDITVRVLDSGGAERGRGIYATVIVPPTATFTTPSPTQTPVTPTATERPLCEDGFDPFENNDDLDSAKEIAINTSQRQAICEVGDEDWVFFSGLAGKVYTIDILEMDAGLDLSLELFDEDERQLAFNDDFFNRDPAAPNPNDLRPRIQSFIVPVNGLYYVRIRDAGGRGGTDEGGEREYVVALIGESYGPTPTNVVALCEDLFEQDGLPEQATLMVINEAQPAHTLCPVGDADWVRFFAKAGKRYILFTDTRPYRPSANANTDTSPGADTTLLLTDRDGRTTLAFNDDIVGGNSFDSLIEFTVDVDGIYFAQIKNVGDVGNQFIRYDLYFLQCLPEQPDCGRTRTIPTSILEGQPTFTPEGGVGTETPTLEGGINGLDATDTAVAGTSFALQTGDVLTAQALDATDAAEGFAAPFRAPDGLIDGPIQSFADPAFALLWQRTDRAVAEQRQIRSWMWGPTWLMAKSEPFKEAPGGTRQVQYFEKGRMEVTNPRGDRESPFFVSSGLLVRELIDARYQVGDEAFVTHAAATLPIAGDRENFETPTYTSFRRLLGKRADDRRGQLVGEALNRAGGVYPYRGPERPETRLTHYVEESGHNIPQVFWDYLNAEGLVWEDKRYEQQPLIDWVATMGYPLSEPYWMWTTVGGMQRQVLVQPFERRVLIYTPDNPSGFPVEMGNVGVHYYEWRYGERLGR